MGSHPEDLKNFLREEIKRMEEYLRKLEEESKRKGSH